MMNIKKRSEKQEEFSNEKTAREISEGVKHRDGLRTSEVRKVVTEKLTHHDAKLGKAYEDYKKPAAVKK